MMKLNQRIFFILISATFLCFLHFWRKMSKVPTQESEVYESSKRSAIKQKDDYIHPWDVWAEMPTNRAITTISELQIDLILNAMGKSWIIAADVGYKGTQLKAQFVLSGPTPQEVVFKPKRYSRDTILGGTPYEGYDRHNGEIAAFHLDRVLGFFRAPPVVGRVVNLRTEVLPVTRDKLLKTFWKDDSGNLCFYGRCMYCKKSESACGKGEIMEGSLTLWMPSKWKVLKMRNPWQRTYRKNKKARWELDSEYCQKVIQKAPYDKGPRLLDLMDTSIFDFLIGNADRHHYEYIEDSETSMLIHLDNGKSFGNPNHDELSILTPLIQCCTLRHSTYISIYSFSSIDDRVSLSHALEEKLKKDLIYPVLTNDHLKAIDRRLDIVMDKLKSCFDTKGKGNVLVSEG